MKLDPSESINNSGNLRVDVLDAADLPSADRNGYSDPYCKFKLNGKEVFKTKVQKKTLHPAWNEFFETPVKSRIGADFRVDVYDWDFGDKADYLGGTPINLEALEPFQPKEVTLPLDGKSGAIRLKLLFKPAYVMRSRQGSSTFHGTFATPGKIVGAPVKGVGIVGGGVVKGASFIKHGLMSRFRGEKVDEEEEEEEAAVAHTNGGHSSHGGHGGHEEMPVITKVDTATQQATVLVDGATPSVSTPEESQPARSHSRTRSIASQFSDRLGFASKADLGTATITIVSASGFPPSANVRVLVKAFGPKGEKDVHKTKSIKSSSGVVQFDPSHETFRVHNTTADAQYQIRVVDHATFGSDDVLGEALFFVDDQGSVAGKEKAVKVGNGTVVVKSSFVLSEAARPGTAYSHSGDASSDMPDSPESRKGPRRFLSKKSITGSGRS